MASIEKKLRGRPSRADSSNVAYSYKACEALAGRLAEAINTLATMGVKTSRSEIQRTAVDYFIRNLDKLAHLLKGGQ